MNEDEASVTKDESTYRVREQRDGEIYSFEKSILKG